MDGSASEGCGEKRHAVVQSTARTGVETTLADFTTRDSYWNLQFTRSASCSGKRRCATRIRSEDPGYTWTGVLEGLVARHIMPW